MEHWSVGVLRFLHSRRAYPVTLERSAFYSVIEFWSVSITVAHIPQQTPTMPPDYPSWILRVYRQGSGRGFLLETLKTQRRQRLHQPAAIFRRDMFGIEDQLFSLVSSLLGA
jgi:hypothetical protein